MIMITCIKSLTMPHDLHSSLATSLFAFVTRWIHASRVPFFESRMLSLQLATRMEMDVLESSKPLKTQKRELEPPQFKKITEGMMAFFHAGTFFLDVWEWHEVSFVAWPWKQNQDGIF